MAAIAVLTTSVGIAGALVLCLATVATAARAQSQAIRLAGR